MRNGYIGKLQALGTDLKEYFEELAASSNPDSPRNTRYAVNIRPSSITVVDMEVPRMERWFTKNGGVVARIGVQTEGLTAGSAGYETRDEKILPQSTLKAIVKNHFPN